MAFQSITTIIDFLEPISKNQLSDDEGYKDLQLGNHILAYENDFPDITGADIVMVGMDEVRGAGVLNYSINSADVVRKHFYRLFHWHSEVTIADIGNIKRGADLNDSYAALQEVLSELMVAGKKIIIIGGSHDLMLAQYNAYASQQKIIEAACADAFIDMNTDSRFIADNFLMKLFTDEPNYLRHYNHIGFQSYFVHPSMLETIDKLRFDCYRVGKVKEHIEEMEPAIRNSHIFSFDITAIQNAHAPANITTPNGFNGEEACTLMQYAGMSQNLTTAGIYGYNAKLDKHELTAIQISHMLWYFADGLLKAKFEEQLQNRGGFNEFKLMFADFETVFLQSKKTGRWWMQLPDESFIACSYRDYLIAQNNDLPERWMRAMERS